MFFHMFTGSLMRISTVLIVLSFFGTQAEICRTVQSKLNKRLHVTPNHTSVANTISSCKKWCENNPRCQSFNFYNVSRTCELLNVNHFFNTSLLQTAENWAYMRNMKHPCYMPDSYPCKNGGRCRRKDGLNTNIDVKNIVDIVCDCVKPYVGAPDCSVKGCAHGWTLFDDSCYKYFSIKETWDNARGECLKVQADLVSVHSLEEMNFLINNFMKETSSKVWSGGKFSKESGLVWSDGTPSNFTFWQGEKDDDKERECVAFEYGGFWDTTKCTSKNLFICKG